VFILDDLSRKIFRESYYISKLRNQRLAFVWEEVSHIQNLGLINKISANDNEWISQ
jgi:hypothetical protein